MMLNGLRSTALCLATALIASFPTTTSQDKADAEATEQKPAEVSFLEIVTPTMDETCAMLAKLHGVTFSDPQMALGNARIAKLKGGGRLSVRKPMHAGEKPVVRPYLLVDDLDAAFKQAEEAGAQIMVGRMEIDGGRFFLYQHGGIEHGVWEK